MKISVSGKGGSGKTTVAGTLARSLARGGAPVLAIDGDSNPNLGLTLGLPADALASVVEIPTDILVEVEGEDGRSTSVLAMDIEEVAARYGSPTPDGVRLLSMKRIEHAGKGWWCGAHATVRSILAAQPAGAQTVIVTDMEAGLEHLSRSTSRASDVMLVVAEPYYKSLETASRITALARQLSIPAIYVVANKVRARREAQAIEAFCTARRLDLIGTIPYDESILDAEVAAQAPLDYCCDGAAVQAIAALAERLAALPARWGAFLGHGY